MTYDEIIDQHNELFEKGELNFVDFDLDELPPNCREWVGWAILHYGHTIKIHKPIIDNDVQVFKINHPKVMYAFHEESSSSHMWGDKNFKNLNNNEALVALWIGDTNPEAAKLFAQVFANMDERQAHDSDEDYPEHMLN